MGSKKSLIGAAGLAAALGVGGVIGAGFGSPGISGALQTPDEETETTAPAESGEAPDRRPFGEHLAVAAEALGMTEEELRDALAVDGATIASIADERGVDVQSVIDAIVADSQDELVERVTAFVNGELHHHHGPGGPGRGIRLEGLEAAATAIGTTVEDLRTELQAGATIASVAEAAGVDVQSVIDAMVADANAEIDEAVAAGRLDPERATELRDALPERVAAAVNGELREGFGHGHGGPPPADSDSETDTGS